MSKFVTAMAQVSSTVSMTAIEVALKALNGTEAFKASGCGYNDKSIIKMAAEILADYASTCSIDGNKVELVGIRRITVPFGVAISLRNGQGRTIRVTKTSFGVRITERNPEGWVRVVSTSQEVKEMLVSFTGAVKA